MSALLSEAIDGAQRLVQELPEHRAFEIAKAVHRELSILVPEAFFSNIPEPITLQSGVAVYELPEDMTGVLYVEAPYGRLFETSIYALGEREAQWMAKIGKPTHYYTAGSQESPLIGVYPTPDTPYGDILVYGYRAPAVTRSSVIAGGMHSHLPYVYGIAYRAATEFRPYVAQLYQQFYAAEVGMARTYAKAFAEGYAGPARSQKNKDESGSTPQ